MASISKGMTRHQLAPLPAPRKIRSGSSRAQADRENGVPGCLARRRQAREARARRRRRRPFNRSPGYQGCHDRNLAPMLTGRLPNQLLRRPGRRLASRGKDWTGPSVGHGCVCCPSAPVALPALAPPAGVGRSDLTASLSVMTSPSRLVRLNFTVAPVTFACWGRGCSTRADSCHRLAPAVGRSPRSIGRSIRSRQESRKLGPGIFGRRRRRAKTLAS